MNSLKMRAAEKALEFVKPNQILGVGTGSTVDCFIGLLAEHQIPLEACVSSSERSTTLLKAAGYEVVDANGVDIELYVDGADECSAYFELIKGGGGALTREKILAAIAKEFVCIVDASKDKPYLGEFPLPIEVIPMARSYVARQIVKMGGNPVYRNGFITDNGGIILDVWGLDLSSPMQTESALNQITGVVCSGLFALRPADILIVASEKSVDVRKRLS